MYHDTQDEKVYQVLSRRMKDRYNIVGGLPATKSESQILAGIQLGILIVAIIIFLMGAALVFCRGHHTFAQLLQTLHGFFNITRQGFRTFLSVQQLP